MRRICLLLVIVQAIVAHDPQQTSQCHPWGGKIVRLKVDESNEWLSSPQAGVIVATGGVDAAVPFFLEAAGDCHTYKMQNKQLNDNRYLGVGECDRAHLNASANDAQPVHFNHLMPNKCTLNMTGRNYLSYTLEDLPDLCGIRPASVLSANNRECDAVVVNLQEDQNVQEHEHRIQLGWRGEIPQECDNHDCTTMAFDLYASGLPTPALFDGRQEAVICPEMSGECQDTLFVVQFNPLLTAENVFKIDCTASGETNFYISQDGMNWVKNGVLGCNQHLRVRTLWKYLAIMFTSQFAQMQEVQLLGSPSWTSGSPSQTPNGFLVPNPSAPNGASAEALPSNCCLSNLESWQPPCPEGQHGYYGSPRCSDQCEDHWNPDRFGKCVPLLTPFLATMPDPVVTMTETMSGSIRISVSTPLTPIDNYEDMSTYSNIDIQTERRALSEDGVDALCNSEFEHRDDIVDDGEGWKNPVTQRSSNSTYVFPVGDINGWHPANSSVEKSFSLTQPTLTPVRVSVQLLLRNASPQDMLYVMANADRVKTVHQFEMCPPGDSPTHMSGCQLGVTFDVDGIHTRELVVRIGSDTFDGEWGFQSLVIHSPVLSAEITYEGFDGPCSMTASENADSIVREGWLRVITRGIRNQNPLELPDQTVGQADQRVTARFHRWVTAPATPLNFWFTQLGINVAVNVSQMFPSVLMLFETERYRVTKQLLNYKPDETIFLQHALPMNEDDAVWNQFPGSAIDEFPMNVREQLYVQVHCAFLSKDMDPTNWSAVVYNFTEIQQDSQTPGLVRFNASARGLPEDACSPCILHVISQLHIQQPTPRRLFHDDAGSWLRRLQESAEAELAGMAIMKLPIQVQGDLSTRDPIAVTPSNAMMPQQEVANPSTADLIAVTPSNAMMPQQEVANGAATFSAFGILGLAMTLRLLG